MNKKQYSLFGLFDLLHPDMTKKEIKYALNYLVQLKIQDGYLKDENIKIFTDKYHYLKEMIQDEEILKCAVPSSLIESGVTYQKVSSYFDKVNLFDKSLSFKRLIYIAPDDQINVGVILSSAEHELEHIHQYQNNIYDNIPYYEYEYYFMPEKVKTYLVGKYGAEKIEVFEQFLEILKMQYFNHHYVRSYMEQSAYAMSTLHLGLNLIRYLEEKPDIPMTRRMWLFKQVKEIYKDDILVKENLAEEGTGLPKRDYANSKYNMIKLLSMVERNEESQELMDVIAGLTTYCRFGKQFKQDYIDLFNLKFYSSEDVETINALITSYYKEMDKENPDFKDLRATIKEKIEVLETEETAREENGENISHKNSAVSIDSTNVASSITNETNQPTTDGGTNSNIENNTKIALDTLSDDVLE